MHVEQIIEFESRGPFPLVHTCTPTSGYFYDKTKTSKKNFLLNSLFTAKILQENGT